MTECTCSRDVAIALKSHIEGREVAPCDRHRPAHMQPAPSAAPQAPALNSDALTNSIIAALGGTNSGANL